MRKLLAYLLSFLLFFSVVVTPIYGVDVIQEKPPILLIDSFYTGDYIEFVKQTKNLKEGDTLKIISIGPGGNAFILQAMLLEIDKLKGRGVKIITESVSFVASANAFIWLAGDERIGNIGDIFMFHKIQMLNSFGQPKERKDMTDDEKFLYDNLNYSLRQRLLNIIGDTNIVNEFLKDGNNWYLAEDLFEIGVVTKLNKMN